MLKSDLKEKDRTLITYKLLTEKLLVAIEYLKETIHKLKIANTNCNKTTDMKEIEIDQVKGVVDKEIDAIENQIRADQNFKEALLNLKTTLKEASKADINASIIEEAAMLIKLYENKI